MHTNPRPNLQNTEPKAAKKPTTARLDGKPKVKMGTGIGILFMSDTLFDEDLKE